MLGGHTRTYRSYGKRTHHTTTTASLAHWLAATALPEHNDEEDTEEADDEDTEWDVPGPRTKVTSHSDAERPSHTLRRTASVPQPRPSSPLPRHSKPTQEQDKENLRTSTVLPGIARRARFVKPRARLVVKSATSSGATTRASRSTSAKPSLAVVGVGQERSPLKPRNLIVPSAGAKKAQPSPSRLQENHRTAFPVEETRPAPAPPRVKSTANPLRSTHVFPHHLSPLLALSRLPYALDFASFIAHPPSPFLASFTRVPQPRWHKVGEASYSEVFLTSGQNGEELVCKVIPVNGRAEADSEQDGEDMPAMSEGDSVERELKISQLVGGTQALDGFVKFKGAFIVQGAYPTELLEAWDVFKKSKSPSDEQICPHVFPATQVYAIIVLENGGEALETYKLKSWREAMSVLCQVAEACAGAEEAVQFEHRDLHWGNVLVRPSSPSSVALPTLGKKKPLRPHLPSTSLTPLRPPPASTILFSNPLSTGIRVTLIDFTLSRVTLAGEDEGWCADLEKEDEVFEGEGDWQFEVYRRMREAVGRDWRGFHPVTNLMWLHYLTLKLLKEKKLKPPSPLVLAAASRLTPASVSSPRTRPVGRRGVLAVEDPKTRVIEKASYDALVKAEKLLGEAVERGLERERAKGKGRSKGKGSAKGRGKETAVVEEASKRNGWSSAADFVRWWKGGKEV